MYETLIRKPAVCGQFYASSTQKLKEDLERLIEKRAKKEAAIGCILPHAGYIYSGSVAGKTVARLKIKENAVLIGPNHRAGKAHSLMSQGFWLTPLGRVEINSSLASSIMSKSAHLSDDASPHSGEHSLEVVMPFLQYLKSDIKIVPILVTESEFSVYQEIAQSIACAIRESNLQDSTLIVASSDMTHYETCESANNKDKAAIRAMEKLDAAELINTVKRLNISMCGAAAAAIALLTAKILGAKSAELASYQTSAEVTGDYRSVVGYAGMIIK